ncbi:MAG: hypothetical protein ACLQKY_04870 [Terracidiphilus sp.]
MLQPVVQLGTAIHGKGFSGGALNGIQKLLRAHKSTPRPTETDQAEELLVPFGF